MLPTPQEQPTMTVAQMAKHLGLGRDKAYALVKNGTIPSISIGRKFLIPTSGIWEFLNIQTTHLQGNNPQ